MQIPTKDTTACVACGEPIVFARETGRIRKGKPAIVALDPVPASAGKWVMGDQGDEYFAGKVRSNQAAGMRAAGVQLHTAHNDTCAKKDEYIRKKRSWNQ